MAHIFTDSQIHGRSLIRKILFAVFLLSWMSIFAQPEIDKKAIKLVEKSDEAVSERDFEKAKELLYSALERDSSYAKSYEKLFTILRILRKPDEIHRLQLRYVANVNPRYLNQQIWQSLASFEFTKGNYALAAEYIEKANRPDSVLFESIKFSLAQVDLKTELQLEELPSSVNRLQHQYLPVLTLDGQTLIFTALAHNKADEDILISRLENGQWTESESISKIINSPYNEGACSISADGRTLIFTSCEGRRSSGNCDLFISRKKGDEWSEPENLGSNVNSRFWDSQPSLSADGKTLYFVSNRPGGRGGRDIWVTRNSKGSWTTPENLGQPINTKRDETTPFIYSDDKTLFFSSNGHVGLGGFDLLKSSKSDEGWKQVENLESPINTHNDEVSLFIASSGDEAYFTKEERQNGVISKSRLVKYQIPVEKELAQKVLYLTGRVFDNETNSPLEAQIELVDLQKRNTSYQTESDPTTGTYFLVLPNSNEYGIFVESNGYLPLDVSFETSSLNTTDTLDFGLSPLKEGSKIVLNNIYFEFDSDQLGEKSIEELDRLTAFLKRETNLKIEISGHTDNIGDSAYNHNLSERRARSVYQYLIQSQVAPFKLSYSGKGDSQPLYSNATDFGQQKNRRIEFKVLSINE